MLSPMAIYLVSGNDEFLASRQIKELVQSVVKADPTLQAIDLDGSELDLNQIGEALSPSLFGAQPPFVIRNLSEINQDFTDQFISLLSQADENQLIVIWHNAGVKGKGVVDKIKKIADHVISLEPIKKESERIEFLKNEFKNLKRKIDPAALTALSNAIGSDLSELASAATQLASDLLPGKTIELVDIERYYAGQEELTGFDVADAVLSRNRVLALTTVRKAITNGVEPIAISSALAAQVRAMAKVSASPRSAKSFELANSLGLAPWQIDKARRGLQNFSPTAFKSMVVLLGQLDLDLKGYAADPLYALERVVITLTDPAF
jgi:DNA polymerase-3 subunit delta